MGVLQEVISLGFCSSPARQGSCILGNRKALEKLCQRILLLYEGFSMITLFFFASVSTLPQFLMLLDEEALIALLNSSEA